MNRREFLTAIPAGLLLCRLPASALVRSINVCDVQLRNGRADPVHEHDALTPALRH